MAILLPCLFLYPSLRARSGRVDRGHLCTRASCLYCQHLVKLKLTLYFNAEAHNMNSFCHFNSLWHFVWFSALRGLSASGFRSRTGNVLIIMYFLTTAILYSRLPGPVPGTIGQYSFGHILVLCMYKKCILSKVLTDIPFYEYTKSLNGNFLFSSILYIYSHL